MRSRILVNKVITAISLFLVFSLAACSTSHKAVDSRSTVIPKSLYVKPTQQKPHLPPQNTTWDDKAAKVGDIITVTINENATSTQSASTNTAKDTSINMQAPNVLGLPSSLGIQNFLNMGTQFDPSVNATIANSMQGTGTVTRNGTLTATISAIITDILPSGNLRIEGRRSVTVNNEEQIMVLRGIVRPQDINFDNTIPSTLIADAAISYTGEGVVADEQRKGWLARVLSKVWPF